MSLYTDIRDAWNGEHESLTACLFAFVARFVLVMLAAYALAVAVCLL